MTDPIKYPQHYTIYPIETIELAKELGFCMGNVVKYVLRAPYKNGVEDCHKAVQYVEFERNSFRRDLPSRIYNIWKEDCDNLCEFLCKANGDILWQDISHITTVILLKIRQYLETGHEALLADISFSVIELRRILELKDMSGQIYAGMTGLPEGYER